VNHTAPSREALFEILDTVKDPEVPVLSIVELGIVRDAVVEPSGAVVVTITPTYSGCPAMHEIEQEIRRAMAAHEIDQLELRTTYTPAWTTDWITAESRAKLEAYGIAPPGPAGPADASELIPLRRRASAVRCPYCKSPETERKSEFGSTACKSIWVCRACRQPFEEFKPI
jgi:ring-1,2-phenylacetyl-CoA epoxidase subunit PaaD